MSLVAHAFDITRSLLYRCRYSRLGLYHFGCRRRDNGPTEPAVWKPIVGKGLLEVKDSLCQPHARRPSHWCAEGLARERKGEIRSCQV